VALGKVPHPQAFTYGFTPVVLCCFWIETLASTVGALKSQLDVKDRQIDENVQEDVQTDRQENVQRTDVLDGDYEEVSQPKTKDVQATENEDVQEDGNNKKTE